MPRNVTHKRHPTQHNLSLADVKVMCGSLHLSSHDPTRIIGSNLLWTSRLTIRTRLPFRKPNRSCINCRVYVSPFSQGRPAPNYLCCCYQHRYYRYHPSRPRQLFVTKWLRTQGRNSVAILLNADIFRQTRHWHILNTASSRLMALSQEEVMHQIYLLIHNSVIDHELFTRGNAWKLAARSDRANRVEGDYRPAAFFTRGCRLYSSKWKIAQSTIR